MAQQAQPHAPMRFDRHVDLLVAGAGAGGMSAALVAGIEGLDVLICKKSQQVEGTASTAAGTLWIPDNTLSRDAGVLDTKEEAQLYLDALMGDTKVFLDKCEEAIGYFTGKTDVQFVPCGCNPDYVTRLPGAAREGRAVIPAAFDGRLLKQQFASAGRSARSSRRSTTKHQRSGRRFRARAGLTEHKGCSRILERIAPSLELSRSTRRAGDS
jgi:glycine/D-amino acid oxidase-like deaminating enzyme